MLPIILTGIYLVFVFVVLVMVVWNMFRTKSISEKVIGAVMVIILILRLLLIK